MMAETGPFFLSRLNYLLRCCMLETKTVSYDTEYNEQLRPITGEQIITVEISPTGSGKSHFYRSSPNTIMLMPTNALVQQYNGLLANRYKREGVKSDWTDIDRAQCTYMTYDKFAGHMKHEDISEFSIILDEAHLLLLSTEDIYRELVTKLILRQIEYRELKLVSATLRPEILKLYHQAMLEAIPGSRGLDVVRYIQSSRELHINFVTNIPKITPKVKTLFFINSKAKMIQVKEYYKALYPDMRVVMLSADQSQTPEEKIFANNDLIISTSMLQYGYSIRTHIDRVIVHNVHNAVGAMGILQYAARPRANQPEIFVVSASTHFTQHNPIQPSIDYLIEKAKECTNSDDELTINQALILNRFLAYTKTTHDRWKIAGVALYYEEMMKSYELYTVINNSEYGIAGSMNQIHPGTTVRFEDNSNKDVDIIQFTITKLEHHYEDYENIHQLRNALYETIIQSNDDNIIHKARTLWNFKPIQVFKLKNVKGITTYFRYTDAIQVRQVLEPKVYKRCKQHVDNDALYRIRDRGDQRNRLKEGEVIPVHFGDKLKRKLGFAKNIFKDDLDPIKIAEMLYSFERYSDIECTNRLHDGQKARAQGIRITSIYPVENGWYEEISKEDYDDLFL